jgi:hypothetical protein
MGRAEDLFDRLVSGGEAAIDDLIADRQSEELFLDFKRSSDDGGGPRLSQGDRGNLAKAVSGFGNSEGGVIVWGVDCRDQLPDGDVAGAKIPLQNPKRYKSWLEGAVSGCTVPPHSRVRHEAIERAEPNAGGGFVATLIPKSLRAPHQCVAPARLEQDKVVALDLGINLTSRGPGLARGAYLTLQIVPPKGGTEIRFIPATANWTGNVALGVRIGLVAKDEFRLAPEAIATPLQLHVRLAPPFGKSLDWTCWYGHEDSPVTMIQREVPASRIQALYEDFVETGDGGHDLVKKVMDIPEAKEPGPEGYEET